MTLDKRFEENYKKAKDAGLKVGVYLFSYDSTEEQVREAARQVTEKLGGEKLDLPVAFDWEDFGSFQTYGLSFYQLNGLYDAFADELSKSGYDCMLYGSKNYLEKVWEDTDTRPVWLAHFTDKTDYKGPYLLWQASCTGNIDGIGGDVDMDIYATGRALKDAGVICGHDITTESALGKLFYLMGEHADNEKVKDLLEKNLKGEISK
jgi:GH25 family lysozyme M1 (1,4-beta-N-acetylmuramidase)